MARHADSVLLIYLTGGASQHDTFDVKPECPAEIRGEFQSIQTSLPGLRFCEHLPLLAQRAHRFSLVRTMSHEELSHPQATHRVLTGSQFPPERNADPVASRQDFPCYAGALQYLSRRTDGIPSGVTLPTFLEDGPTIWPGQNAGCLGARFDPWQIKQDPNSDQFREQSLTFAEGNNPDRLAARRGLLLNLARENSRSGNLSDRGQFVQQQQLAVDMLTSGAVARAFQIEKEPAAVRDRYGRHQFGQSLLLSRRLIEAGVPFVQANMGPVQHWDTHVAHFIRMKQLLLPPLDQGLSALLDDLRESGRLEKTLVVVTGEFGRTPKISTLPGQAHAGRDHWSSVFSAVFAGAGVSEGKVLGRSDEIGAYPLTRTFSLYDLGATIYDSLGVPIDTEIRDQLSRPLQLNRGEPIHALFTSDEV
jgi:hypothetical protein